MKPAQREATARLGTILANPLRLAILERLAEGPHIVSELMDALGEPQPLISKHLATLREAGLLECEPDGRCRIYRLANVRTVRRVLSALAALAATAQACAGQQVAAG